MTVILFLALVALGVALQRQARRIDALERQLAELGSSEPVLPAVPPIVSPPPVRPRAARVILPPVAEPTTVAAEPVAPAPEAAPAPAPAASALFEQLVGGRLPIWVGGAALAVAGYFLVRLAIESGLLGPWVRVLLATLFGFALLAAGEAAARLPRVADDPRVGQALSGAGIATLYAAIYLAGSHYGLVGPVAAFVLLAAVTGAAIGLSLRRGAPVALMALAGGFATPLLAGGQKQAVLPLLAYLALLTGGLFWLSIVRGWLWLALAAAGGSLAWTALLIVTAAPADALAAGVFTLLLAVAATLATGRSGQGVRAAILRAVPLVVAAAELAMLVGRTGFGGEAWALYLLLSAATIFLAWRDSRLTPAVVVALCLSAVALAGGAALAPLPVALAATVGIALLFGGAGHALASRTEDGPWWAVIGVAGLAAPLLILWQARPGMLPDAGWSVAALLLALPPLHLAWRRRDMGREAAPFDIALAVSAGGAAALLAHGLAGILPDRMVAATLLVPALLLAEGSRRLGDGGLARLASAAAGLAVLAIAAAGAGLLRVLGASLTGDPWLLPLLPAPAEAIQSLLLPAPLVALVAWRSLEVETAIRRLLVGAAALALAAGLYALWKQVFAIRPPNGFLAYGFLERAILTQALFAAGWALASRGLGEASRVMTLVATFRVLWFDLLVCNPAFVEQAVGPLPLANLVTVHFALASLWIGFGWNSQPPGRRRLAALAVLVAVAAGGTLLTVRQAFHGSLLPPGPLGRAEFYGYSVGGVLLAVALFGVGAALRDRAMRIAATGLLTLMVLKVFLIDAAALGGLLRIASFLGLGLTLIAIGWAYGRLLGREARPVVG